MTPQFTSRKSRLELTSWTVPLHMEKTTMNYYDANFVIPTSSTRGRHPRSRLEPLFTRDDVAIEYIVYTTNDSVHFVILNPGYCSWEDDFYSFFGDCMPSLGYIGGNLKNRRLNAFESVVKACRAYFGEYHKRMHLKRYLLILTFCNRFNWFPHHGSEFYV
jgi:uncharacterized protein CbrC (UPF0167 family)